MKNKIELDWKPMGPEFDEIDGDQMVAVYGWYLIAIQEKGAFPPSNMHGADENYHYAIIDIQPPPKKFTWEDPDVCLVNVKNGDVKTVRTPIGVVIDLSDTKEWKKACAVNVVWRKIQELNDGWEPDWGDSDQPKNGVDIVFRETDIESNHQMQTRSNWQYLKSYGACQALINSIEEETLKLALFE